jgi:hypothetical protein
MSDEIMLKIVQQLERILIVAFGRTATFLGNESVNPVQFRPQPPISTLAL